MSQFSGFPSGKLKLTPVPDLFFSELLPSIDDMGELQVLLFMFWFLHRQTGYPRYMMMSELENESLLSESLVRTADSSDDTVDAKTLLRQAVRRAVEHQSLLMLEIGEDAEQESYLFINTAQGRKAIEEIARGELVLETSGRTRQVYVKPDRPNIFALYEDNIGLLGPMLVEELKQAAQDYPEQWIEDAFRIAVESNARNWRYVRAVLERWSVEGREENPRWKNR